MELEDAAVAVPSEARCRQDCLRADLEILPGPDDPGLDRTGCLTPETAIE